jgi:hypothetical protein
MMPLKQAAPDMGSPAPNIFFVVITTALMLQSSLGAGTIRLSYLNDEAALRETVGILTNNGCAEESGSIFRRVVERYYAVGFDLDLSRFPERQNGFYSFPTMLELVEALPHKLSETKHVWDFNCFETVIMLAAGKLQIGLRPDENFGPFVVTTMMTNGEESVTFAATARDAFMQIYKPWYLEATESIIPRSMQDARICLTAALFRWQLLPMATSEATLDAEAVAALRADWRRENLKFPQQFEIVLVHNADLQAHTICTFHAGLLLHRKTGFTYLEKAGGSGPFARLDFDDRSELLQWLSAFDKGEHRYSHLIATFNDARFEKLDSR